MPKIYSFTFFFISVYQECAFKILNSTNFAAHLQCNLNATLSVFISHQKLYIYESMFRILKQVLTHLSQMEFPIFINWASLFLGCSGRVKFSFLFKY